jgi:glyoxylase-like metal-dependent hydrolase (beta-lactamase superfamily II)
MKEIAPNIYASTDYPYVNVGFIVREAGVIAIDAPTLPRHAREWRQRIAETTDAPILYTVVTDAHPDRLLCAGLLDAPIVSSQAAYEQAADYSAGFWRTVIRRLKRRFPEEEDSLGGVDAVLPEVLFKGNLTLHKGGTDVTITEIGGGAPGSVWVDLYREGAIFTGDVLTVGVPPLMEETPDTKAWLNTLTTLRRPRFLETIIVPGRGPLSDQSATEPLSECIRVARRRIRSLHREERPDDDVKEFIDEILAFFPTPEGSNKRFNRRVKNGLERVYEELAPPEEDSE